MPPISYELRPSKDVVRKIFIDLLRRLTPIESVDKYHYVGFGALEFLDFDLIHRRLGITHMTSIEKDTASLERFKWNRPFRGIEILSGHSSDVLSSIDWKSGLCIVWLDYTSCLSMSVISDLDYLLSVLMPGSVVAITLNAHPTKPIGERRKRLENEIGAENVPIGTTNARLGDWGLGEIQHKVMSDLIARTLDNRPDGANWNQLLNIFYQDSAKMQLVAGIVGSPGLMRQIESCRFSEFAHFCPPESPASNIKVPLLTLRERAQLNTMLPSRSLGGDLELPGVDPADIEAYAEIYRWLDPAAG